jgi:serine phosphatase RsbU (regulator of sigma subunit)
MPTAENPESFAGSFDEVLALQQQIARLQALLEVSRQVHGTIELESVVHSTLEVAAKELEADGVFFTPSPLLQKVETSYGNVEGLDLQSLPEDATTVPIIDRRGNEITKMIVVRRGNPLSLEEQDFLEGLALQSGVAIENAHHHQRMLAWERVKQDLAAARAIQQGLLPQTVPTIPGYQADFRAHPCYEVGGDYLDILTLPDGRLVMVVADVAGKGLASALVSASFRSAFRAMAFAGVPLETVASRINDLHHAEGVEAQRRYVTAMFMGLDLRNHTIEVVNAGHNPGFLADSHGSKLFLEASGPPIGLISGMSYQREVYEVKPGTKLLLYTDGLVEVFRGNEEFGTDRLFRRFLDCPPQVFSGMLTELWRELSEFSTSPQQSDDMTALSLVRLEGND